MDDLTKEYLGVSTIHYEDVAGKGAKQIPFPGSIIGTSGPLCGWKKMRILPCGCIKY